MSQSSIDVIQKANQSIRRFVLDNGLTVLLKEDHAAPLLAIQYWVGAGSIHEEDQLGGGLSHYLEHMIFKGTETRAPGVISKEIADAGGEINAYTSNDRTVYHVVMPSEQWENGLDILTDAVFHPSFPEEEWLREREVVLRECDMGDDDPARVISRLSWETAFVLHPYRVPVIGWRDILITMERQQLVEYHARHYSPDNMILSIAGAFSAKDMEAAIRTRMDAIPRTPRKPVFIPAEPPQQSERIERKTGPYEVTRLVWSFHTVALSDDDTAALDVLAAVTGSGRSSRLVRRLKEEAQLVLDIDTWSYTPQYPGLFSIYAECEPEREEDVIAALREEVQQWHGSIFDSAQIDRARREVLVQSIRALTTVEGQASSMASGEFYAADPRHIEAYLQSISRVTPDDLARVARKYLFPANGSWAILAPQQEAAEMEAAAQTGDMPVTDFTLEFGLRVLIMENPRLPLVYVSTVIGGGLLGEAADKAGISQLTAELLTRGTSRTTAAQLAEMLEARAIEMHPFSGRNSYGFSAVGLSEDTRFMLDTLAQCLLDSQFPEEELNKQRTIQLAALRREAERPMSHANQMIRDAFFNGHPYQHSLNGTAETVTSCTVEDLKQHHQRLLTAPNMVLAVFGDVDAQAVKTQIEEAFAALPAYPAPEWPPLPSVPAETRRLEKELPFKQTVLVRAWPGLSNTDPREDALSICIDALSGLSSDLFVEVRDKRGLAYYTGATQFTGPAGGLFMIYAGTTPEGLEEVEQQIQLQVDRLCETGVRQEELQRAIEQTVVDEARERQNPGALAQHCALDELFGLGYQHTLDTTERIRRITLEDARQTAASLLQDTPSISAIVKPADASEE